MDNSVQVTGFGLTRMVYVGEKPLQITEEHKRALLSVPPSIMGHTIKPSDLNEHDIFNWGYASYSMFLTALAIAQELGADGVALLLLATAIAKELEIVDCNNFRMFIYLGPIKENIERLKARYGVKTDDMFSSDNIASLWEYITHRELELEEMDVKTIPIIKVPK